MEVAFASFVAGAALLMTLAGLQWKVSIARYDEIVGREIATALLQLKSVAEVAEGSALAGERGLIACLERDGAPQLTDAFQVLVRSARLIYQHDNKSGAKWCRKVEECRSRVQTAFDCLMTASRRGDRLQIAYYQANLVTVINRVAAQLGDLERYTRRRGLASHAAQGGDLGAQ